MQQSFSLQRCSLLIAKHWAENKRRYLLSFAAYISLVFVWFVFIMMTDRIDPMAEGLQRITFYFSAIVVGPFYASQFFKELGSKSKGTSYLMVPASSLEKLVCSLIYAMIFFPLALLAAFYIVDVLAVLIANSSHSGYNGGADPEGNILKAKVVNLFGFERRQERTALYYGILVFFAIQSAALLGSIYFAQYSYIKTAIALTLLFLFGAWFEHYVMEPILPNGNFHNNITRYSVNEGGQFRLVQLPSWVSPLLEIGFFYGATLTLWTVSYFRLKEKEV
ncbi:MAG TPA: hypothetical protein VM935_10205 [Chitinophagaceae bacterium]|jgi:hypothetical protein|nr:hypothetical protein [Chitinophagaceae bacterium]